jgi:hypothetical protein
MKEFLPGDSLDLEALWLMQDEAAEADEAAGAEAREVELAQKVLRLAAAHAIAIPEGVTAERLTKFHIAAALGSKDIDPAAFGFFDNVASAISIAADDHGDVDPKNTLGDIACSFGGFEDKVKWVQVIEDLTGSSWLRESDDDNRILLAGFQESREASIEDESLTNGIDYAVRDIIMQRIAAKYGEHDDLPPLAIVIVIYARARRAGIAIEGDNNSLHLSPEQFEGMVGEAVDLLDLIEQA